MIKFNIAILLGLFLLFQACASDYSHLDPDHEISKKLLKNATDYFDAHQLSIHNKRYLGIIDFSLHNSKERLFIIDMDSGRVDKFLVAHGKNSDPNWDGYATKFSNVIDSKMTSLGFYLTAETYEGEHGLSLRLDGLSESNSNARERLIVIHAADYVAPGSKIGRSSGCPAVEARYHQLIIDELKEGALIYAAR